MKHIALIKKITASFIRSSNLDFDDVFQTAAEIILKSEKNYNPENGAKTTYITACLERQLPHFVRREAAWQAQQIEYDECFSEPAADTTALLDFIGDLSPEAAEVVKMILDTPSEFSGLAEVKAELRKRKTTQRNIDTTVKEIKAALQSNRNITCPIW